MINPTISSLIEPDSFIDGYPFYIHKNEQLSESEVSGIALALYLLESRSINRSNWGTVGSLESTSQRGF